MSWKKYSKCVETKDVVVIGWCVSHMGHSISNLPMVGIDIFWFEWNWVKSFRLSYKEVQVAKGKNATFKILLFVLFLNLFFKDLENYYNYPNDVTNILRGYLKLQEKFFFKFFFTKSLFRKIVKFSKS